MTYLGKVPLWSALSLFLTTMVHGAETLEHGGFVLGSSLNTAQQHARERGWSLAPLSQHLPGHWQVEGANLTLFVCDDQVTSVQEQLFGDLEEYSARVFSMQRELGEPDIQILSLHSGVGVISTIDARFVTNDGGATVHLQSISGKRTFTVNHWIESECR
ncbi:MAG: hypothetical protein DI616_14690 [Paracoccus denitrificans]|uniref:Uncharacterized protein n=1 Tax=Paracoccus denitrificans TaxID=266 RepID=A0A533I6V4_PARDE|nr:MAG: hypothetical protein DI616_14690 [Paracoccus denitrificans]